MTSLFTKTNIMSSWPLHYFETMIQNTSTVVHSSNFKNVTVKSCRNNESNLVYYLRIYKLKKQ